MTVAVPVAGPVPPTARRPRQRQRQLKLVEDISGPIVKWAGGKTKLLGELVPRMPSSFGRYLEPFAGGAALFFRALPASAILGDSNEDLIELYVEIARDPAGLHGALRLIYDQHARDPEGTYYSARAAWNDDRCRWIAQRRAAMFLYLNKACFNGLFRLNRSGKFNVPIGRQSSGAGPSCPSLPRLVAAQSALRGASLRCADYVEILAEAERGDFVYLDPPYLPIGDAASFASYTEDGFGLADHEELARHACALVDRGVLVMVSNADTIQARELYRGFSITSVSSPRSINARGDGRGKVGEVIAIAGYAPERRSS